MLHNNFTLIVKVKMELKSNPLAQILLSVIATISFSRS